MDSIIKNGRSDQGIHFDWYTIAKDVLREWSIIVMISIAAVLFSYTYQYLRYVPSYSMTATFTVSSRVAVTDVYSNLSNTSTTADTFARVLDSSLMQKKVAKDIGMSYMPGTAKVNMVESTNLLELTVVEATPKLTNDVYHSIMKNYYDIAEPLLGDIVLNTLIDSEIPTKAQNPFKPQDGMVKSFFFALLGSIAFLTMLVFMKDTVRTEADVEAKLDTKILGTLYHEKKYKKGQKKKSFDEKKTILISDPMISFRYVEAMKKIGNKMATMMDRRNAKTVLVTSVMENEGKSTIAANLALALSKRSNKVLLIDGDFRKPALYKVFDIDPKDIENFGEVLNGNADFKQLICRKDNINLSMILNSVRYPDSTDMIAQDLMSTVIHILEKEFDYIVIDSSPMALVADTQEWMEIIDSAVLVVRQNMSSVRDINDAIAILNRGSVKLLGCVFNNVEGHEEKFSNSSYGYGKYGKYGGYGQYNSYEEQFETYAQYSDYSSSEDAVEVSEIGQIDTGDTGVEYDADMSGTETLGTEARSRRYNYKRKRRSFDSQYNGQYREKGEE